ncbi:MAG: TatD family deoxyribonuclease [Bacteroidetes bacterium]|nr:MAG: TatD family deoxyribonuclease [Bacteroidota bacterium]
MLIDTHTHIYLKHFDNDREAMLERAARAGVTRFYLPNIDSSSISAMLNLEAQHPDTCFAMMGLHPCSVKSDYKKELSLVEEWLGKRPFCAVGEIGIDLHWDKTTLDIQKDAFLTQIEWAKTLGLPIVIHCRDAMDLTIDLVRQAKDERLRGIFHCFGGTLEQAREIIELGFYLGIGGVLTYKKSGLDKVLSEVPLESVVLETDAPYLAPVPYRGKRNESAWVRIVAERLAEVKGLTINEIAIETTKNAEKIFRKIKPETTIKPKAGI